MITNANNKNVDQDTDSLGPVAEKPVIDPSVTTTDQVGKQLFHFAGSGIFRPLSVWAENEAKAIEAWVKARVPFK